mgnify:CR=1 FL=1
MQHIDRISSKLHGGNITYVIRPNMFEQRVEDSDYAKKRSTVKEELRRVFDRLIDFDDVGSEDHSGNKNDAVEDAHTSHNKHNQVQKHRNNYDNIYNTPNAIKDVAPPEVVESNTLLYWIMTLCCPDRMLLADEDDLVSAVKEYRREFSKALSSDIDFTREYTFPDDMQRSSDKKTCSEALLRCLHYHDWDVLLHDAIPSYAAKSYGINITISDMNGVYRTYPGNENDNRDHLVLVPTRNGRFHNVIS